RRLGWALGGSPCAVTPSRGALRAAVAGSTGRACRQPPGRQAAAGAFAPLRPGESRTGGRCASLSLGRLKRGMKVVALVVPRVMAAAPSESPSASVQRLIQAAAVLGH